MIYIYLIIKITYLYLKIMEIFPLKISNITILVKTIYECKWTWNTICPTIPLDTNLSKGTALSNVLKSLEQYISTYLSVLLKNGPISIYASF